MNYLHCIPNIIQGIIASLIQLFFAWRVHVLTRSWWLVSLVLATALSGGGKHLRSICCLSLLILLAAGIATAFEVINTPDFVDFRDFKVGGE